MTNGTWQSLGLDLVNIDVYAIFHQNIPSASKDPWPVSLRFRNLDLGKDSTNENSIYQSLGLDLVNSNVYAIFHQNSSRASRDRACQLGWILSVLMHMQYCIKIFYTVQEIGPGNFLFPNLDSDKVSTNGIWQSLGLDLVNINVYAILHQNILHGSRDRDSQFPFS